MVAMSGGAAQCGRLACPAFCGSTWLLSVCGRRGGGEALKPLLPITTKETFLPDSLKPGAVLCCSYIGGLRRLSPAEVADWWQHCPPQRIWGLGQQQQLAGDWRLEEAGDGPGEPAALEEEPGKYYHEGGDVATVFVVKVGDVAAVFVAGPVAMLDSQGRAPGAARGCCCAMPLATLACLLVRRLG